MVQTEEERKASKREYDRLYYENNKEKRKEEMKEYYQNNIEYSKEYSKEYIKTHKEEKKKYDKKYREKNKEEKKKYRKTPNRIKSNNKRKWKSRGLKDSNNDKYEKLYDLYLNTNECDVCKYEFDKSNVKNMDHCHSTGLFRQILCHRCNMMDNWIKVKAKIIFKKVLENILEL